MRILMLGPLTPSELGEKMDLPLNRDFSELIKSPELAGFIRRDFSWHFSGKLSRISQLRISDNYTKFFLKYVEPQKQKLTKIHNRREAMPQTLPWATILELQFENLILNNINILIDLADIPPAEIVQIGPYYQTATKTPSAVQIDCLV